MKHKCIIKIHFDDSLYLIFRGHIKIFCKFIYKSSLMKRFYFYCTLAIALLLSISAKAQAPYKKMLAPNTTDWYIFQVFIPVKHVQVPNNASFMLNGGRYSAMGDTNILSNYYKKIYHEYYSPGNNQHWLLGYMREDTINRKIYFLDKMSTTEDLLYDFSLTVGSSTQLNFPGSFGSFPAGTYTVTHVDSVMTRVGFRKQMKLIGPGSDTLIHIESIGNVMHPLYLYGYFSQGGMFYFNGNPTCDYKYELGLACKYSDNEKYYQSCTYTLAQSNNCIFKYDSCNYYTNCSSVKEINNISNYMLVPNPATDVASLQIDLINDDLFTIEIYDVSGRKLNVLYHGKQNAGKASIALNLSKYGAGYYFIKIESISSSIYSPIIITR